MPQGLVQWQTFLADKQLPVLPRTKTDVQGLIDQAQLSITQYAAPIVYDAGFCAHIFRHVNTQREVSGRNPLTTLGNALSHLGQSAFQRFLNKTPLLESLNLAERNVQGYMRVMGEACHGALQATEWALQRNVVETEETQLAALLQKIPELMLWCYGDNAMPEIEELCYVEKQPYEQAAKTVLGCGMRELGGKLAGAWHLPEMAIDGLLTKQDNYTLATGVSLASELARLVAINWYGKDVNDIIQQIAKYKGKLEAEGEIEHRLHLNAVYVNDVLLGRGYAAPAKLLFQLADDAYRYPQFILRKDQEAAKTEKPVKRPAEGSSGVLSEASSGVKSRANREEILQKIKARKRAVEAPENKPENKPKRQALKQAVEQPAKQTEKQKAEKSKSVKPGTVEPLVNKTEVKSAVSATHTKSANSPAAKPLAEKKSTPDKSKTSAPLSKELALAIKEFQLMVTQAKPAHDLIEHAVKTVLLCGVQRSVFVIKLPGKDLLVSRYTAQVSDEIAIKGLKIPVDKSHVFKLLMEKSRNLFLNNSNSAKYWNFIPEPVKQVIGVRSFFAMSIFVNNHAMGLMYADKLKGELTAAEFTQFQGVCRLLSKGIAQSAKNKKK